MAKKRRAPWDMHYRSRVEKKTGDVIVTLWWWHVIREHVYADTFFSEIAEPGLISKHQIAIRFQKSEWVGDSPNVHYNAHQAVMRKLMESELQSDLASYSRYADGVVKHVEKFFGPCEYGRMDES